MTSQAAGAPAAYDPYQTALRFNPGVAVLELESFSPATAPLAATQRAFIEFITRNGDNFTNPRHTDGHLVASAVVLHPTKPLVAVHRRSPHSPWTLPDGHVSLLDDKLSQTAWREASQKLGLDGHLEALEKGPVFLHAEQSTRHNIPAHLHAVATFSFRAGRGKILATKERHAVDWVKPDALAARLGAQAQTMGPLIAYIQKVAG